MTLNYVEIDQSLCLWEDLFPLVESHITGLTNIAQEMQESAEQQKYVQELLNIAIRFNDSEEKARTCLKEARRNLKKSTRRAADEEDEEEEIDDSELKMDIIEKLYEKFQKILVKTVDTNTPMFDLEADNRYQEFGECIENMKHGSSADTAVIDQVTSSKCPLTQKTFHEAVQNKKCKHRYEKEAVLQYISDKQKSRRKAQCPVAGCDNILIEKDLVNV